MRTLHYYEEIGLLEPSGRTRTGHRLYCESDVERLYRIRLLRSLGFSLDRIASVLDQPGWELRPALRAHLEHIDDRLNVTARLRSRLESIVQRLDESSSPATDELMAVLEEMNMLDTVQRRIAVLVYRDLDAAHRYLVDVFGLGAGPVTRNDDGEVVHAEVRVGDGVIWLHPERPQFQLASPRTLGGASAAVAVLVDDVDEHHRYARSRGAEIVYEPMDQPYGYREYSARDLEGTLWSFMKPID